MRGINSNNTQTIIMLLLPVASFVLPPHHAHHQEEYIKSYYLMYALKEEKDQDLYSNNKCANHIYELIIFKCSSLCIF